MRYSVLKITHLHASFPYVFLMLWSHRRLLNLFLLNWLLLNETWCVWYFDLNRWCRLIHLFRDRSLLGWSSRVTLFSSFFLLKCVLSDGLLCWSLRLVINFSKIVCIFFSRINLSGLPVDWGIGLTFLKLVLRDRERLNYDIDILHLLANWAFVALWQLIEYVITLFLVGGTFLSEASNCVWCGCIYLILSTDCVI